MSNKTTLQKIVGRIKKMRIWREVILIAFGFIFSILFPAIAEITDKPRTVIDNPVILIVIAIPTIAGGLLLWFARSLDKIEQEKDDERLKGIIAETVTATLKQIKKEEQEKEW